VSRDRILLRGRKRDYFPLTLTLSPIGGEGIRKKAISALIKISALARHPHLCVDLTNLGPSAAPMAFVVGAGRPLTDGDRKGI